MIAPEIIACPLTLYVGEVGTPYPGLHVTPDPSDWFKVGSSGDLNYTEDGLTLDHQRSVKLWRSVGDFAPRKGFLDTEAFILKLILADMTLEQYAMAMNFQSPTDVAAGVGTPGERWIGLSHGALLYRALLLRGPRASGYGEGWPAQYEIPVSTQTGSPSLVYRRADPVGIALEFNALVDPTASSENRRLGRLRMQDAEALT